MQKIFNIDVYKRQVIVRDNFFFDFVNSMHDRSMITVAETFTYGFKRCGYDFPAKVHSNQMCIRDSPGSAG